MSDIAIKFENISKQYRLGLVGTGTIAVSYTHLDVYKRQVLGSTS